MKKLAVLLLTCLTCSIFAAEPTLEQGKALLNQQEYEQALELFNSIIQQTNPVLEQSEYLTAALHAMIAALRLNDFQAAAQYNNLMQSQLQTTLAFNVECHAAFGYWICNDCGRRYISHPGVCKNSTCKGTSFTFMSTLPPEE